MILAQGQKFLMKKISEHAITKYPKDNDFWLFPNQKKKYFFENFLIKFSLDISPKMLLKYLLKNLANFFIAGIAAPTKFASANLPEKKERDKNY